MDPDASEGDGVESFHWEMLADTRDDIGRRARVDHRPIPHQEVHAAHGGHRAGGGHDALCRQEGDAGGLHGQIGDRDRQHVALVQALADRSVTHGRVARACGVACGG